MEQDFVKEMTELINEEEKEKAILKEKYDQLENELWELEQRIKYGHDYIKKHMNKYNIASTTPENLKLGNLSDKNYPKLLIDIAKQSNGGIVKIADATEILYKAGMDTNKKAIAHNVGNTLTRMQNFVRIGRGQYRFTNHIQTNEIKQKNGMHYAVKDISVTKPAPTKEKSGVREVVKAIREHHPEWNNRKIAEALIQSGFDFKGKRPLNAVNMALASLAYLSNSKKQLPKQKVNVIEVPESLSEKIIGHPTIGEHPTIIT